MFFLCSATPHNDNRTSSCSRAFTHVWCGCTSPLITSENSNASLKNIFLIFTFDIKVYINTGIGEICMEPHEVRLKKSVTKEQTEKSDTCYMSITNRIWVTSCKHGKIGCSCACHVCIHTVSTYIAYVYKRNHRLRPVPAPIWRSANVYEPDFRTQREPVRRPLRLVQVGLCARASVRVTERMREREREREGGGARATGREKTR